MESLVLKDSFGCSRGDRLKNKLKNKGGEGNNNWEDLLFFLLKLGCDDMSGAN